MSTKNSKATGKAKAAKEIKTGTPEQRHAAVAAVLELRKGHNISVAEVLEQAAAIEQFIVAGKHPEPKPTVVEGVLTPPLT